MIPADTDAERMVLGCIMLDEACAAETGRLTEEMFYDETNRTVFKAIKTLFEQRKPINTITVTPMLAGKVKPSYILDMTGSVYATAEFNSYVDVLREMAIRRKAIQTLSKDTQLAYDTTNKSFLQDIEEDVFTLAADAITHEEARGIFDVTTNILEQVEARYKAGGTEIIGLSTGFQTLDRYMGGLQPGELVVIAGRPSMGKTALGLNMAVNFAKKYQTQVTIFSLEMTAEQLAYRILSMISKIDSMKIRAGKLTDKEIDYLAAAMSTIGELPLKIIDTPGLGMADIRSMARRIAQANNNKMGMVVIDYLQLARVAGKNIVFEFGQVAKEAKEMAKELNCPVILLSQLSRACDARQNHRPILSDLRESGGIEAAADKVIMLYRDEYYNPDTQDKGIAEVIIAKSRDGSTGAIKMAWLPTLTLFGDLEKYRKEN